MSDVLMAVVLAAVAASAEGVSGTVVDRDGNPIENAKVWLVKNNDPRADAPSTNSDAEGRFHFTAEAWQPRDWARWAAVAHRPGLALGFAEIDSTAVASRPVRIELEPADAKMVRVIGPDREPVTAGRLSFTYFRVAGRYVSAKQTFRKNFSFAPDERGRATVDVLPPGTRFRLMFESDTFGEQHISFDAGATDLTVPLRTPGRVTGRVVAAEPEAVAGLRIEITSRPAAPRQAARAGSRRGTQAKPITRGGASVITDDSGRFEVPALAAGTLRVSVETKNDLPFRTPGPVTAELVAGATVELDVELVRGVPVAGSVLDDETSEPIAGAQLFAAGAMVVTDERGRYETFAAPGAVYVSLRSAPELYLLPISPYRHEKIKPDAEEHQFRSFRLKKGRALPGVVVDEDGKPVAGAKVAATWQKTNGRVATIGSRHTVADADGRFELRPVPLDAEVGLIATSADRGSETLLRVQPDTEPPVRVPITHNALAVITGRVLDAGNQPVAGARVKFRKATRIPSGQVYGQSLVRFGKGSELTTGTDGIFRTPTRLLRGEQYELTVEADRMVSHQSGYLTLARTGDPVRLDDVVLEFEASVAGSVVDEAGNPVAGATVWVHGQPDQLGVTRVDGKTQGDGTFHLDRMHPEARFVFVEKDGRGLRGAVIPRSGEAVQITLPTRDAREQPLRSLERSREERHRLLAALFEPIAPRLFESDSDYLPLELIKRLVPYDPDFALEALDELDRDRSRADVLFALGEIDDGLEFTRLEKNPYRKVLGYLGAVDALQDAARKKQVLAEALLAARRIEKPDRRVLSLGAVAERLYDLGELAAARKVVDEGHAIADQLAPTGFSGYTRGSFAKTVALFDPSKARELVQTLKDEFGLARHTGNIAHELAGVNPVEAERFLALIERERNIISYVAITSYVVRICYRMAKADLPRARKIADAIGTVGNKAHAYGVMAMAIAERDPDEARQLLRQAFDQLASSSTDVYRFRKLFPVAFTLVRFSETVDPGRTRDYFWQALALNPGPSDFVSSPKERIRARQQKTAHLVILLGLYEVFPELRAELMAPLFERLTQTTDRKAANFYHDNAVLTAMALTDPERILAWHREFHPKLSEEDLRLSQQPWMTIADVFGNEGPALGKRIAEEVFHLWTIDKEDL